MSGYSSLAKFYDLLTRDYDYEKYYRFIKPYIGKSIVELGAGTGKFTREYIDCIRNAQLVEISNEMLSQANANLLKYRKKCLFIKSDMFAFKPMHHVDTVLSVCDGFNYIDDIDALLDKIDSYLSIGGSLIFDISSEYKLKNIIGNNVFYEDYDNLTYLWSNKLTDNYVDMDVVIFEKTDNGLYRRSDDVSRQYAHSAAQLNTKLVDLGYTVKMYDGDNFNSATDISQRILFIAVKQ